MARVSIYVDDDLKARMDETGGEINWSEVARPAFESAIANLKHQRSRTMDTAIERLRASKQKAVEHDFERGRIDGRDWAQDTAEYADLANLAKVDLNRNYQYAWKMLKKAVSPEDEMSDGEIKEYCFGGDETALTDEYVGGFVDGAQEFFEQIKGRL
jgi:hypothetical protein